MLKLLAQEPAASPQSASQNRKISSLLGSAVDTSPAFLFVATVVLAVFIASAYLAGKSASPRKPPFVPVTVVQAPAVEPPPPPPPPEPVVRSEPPIFSDPAVGAIYLQVGSVDRGISVILARGSPETGFNAFAAPGTSDKVFRVLIGPLPDPQAFVRAKESETRSVWRPSHASISNSLVAAILWHRGSVARCREADALE